MIVILLAIGFVKAAVNEQGVLCESDTARTEWLLSYGVTAESEPIYVREAVVGSGGGWEEYLSRLKANGFDLSSLNGKRVTFHCYMGEGEYADCYIRTVSLNSRAVGYDISAPVTISKSDTH